MSEKLTPHLLLNAYAQGYFPMAVETGEIMWFSPNPRAVFDLDNFHVPRTLRQLYRQKRFELTVDRCFPEVIAACADRPEGTWINPEIHESYCRLHELGHAHSVETWRDGELVGGLYGVALAGAFFGESMFSRVSNASKVALVYLVERLRAGGFVLLDTQFTNEHLEQFQPVEIPRKEYLRRLAVALEQPAVLTE
ncbi:MAG TPA: leucyl/phenylalanyl-tRNA--protein transferase [Phycisphaerae bacterium]|nr:leucyl/phenylalanyl-tRNA--protein transferase [Phycisphaerae bacterium]